MTEINQNFERWAGEAWTITFTVVGDLTGKAASWILQPDRDSTAATLTKVGVVTGGVSESTVAIALAAADTAALSGVYYHRCTVTEEGGASSVIAEGWATINARTPTGLYCSLNTLKHRLSVTDNHDDAELERIITAVSRAIDDYCDRRFYAATETRYYRANRCDRLLVDDLLSVTTLATDPGGSRTYPETWAATDYDLGPENAALDGEPYWEIRISPNGRYSFPSGMARGVKLVGSFGYSAATPPVVEDACLAQCKIEYQARNANETMGENGSEGGAKVSLHPFVKRALDPYRRIGVA